jgi:hypothetical protein
VVRRWFTWERVILWIAGVHVSFLGLWLVSRIALGTGEGDWIFLRDMGRLFLDGDWDGIYLTSHDGYYWRFPPYGLYPAAVLALLPRGAAYWVKAGVEVTATLAGFMLLRSVMPAMRNVGAVLFVVLGSAAFATNVYAGQNAGTMLFLIALGLWAAERRSTSLGFGTWGLLALKPNIGIGFGLLALVRRRTREIGAIAGVAVLVAATSLPLWWLWDDFVRASFRAEEIRAGYAAAKQVTVLGFLDGALLPTGWALAVWAVAAVVLTVVAARVWASGVPFIRKVGAVVLLVVSANPYLSFYDALLLVVPGMVWWGAAGSYRSHRARAAIGACLAVVWFDQHLSFSYLQVLDLADPELLTAPFAPFSLVGPAVAAWLVLEAIDARSTASPPAGAAAEDGRSEARSG